MQTDHLLTNVDDCWTMTTTDTYDENSTFSARHLPAQRSAHSPPNLRQIRYHHVAHYFEGCQAS